MTRNVHVGTPQVGQWYFHTDKGESFQVVGFDQDSGDVEIQTIDGDVDEIDAEAWNTLAVERSEPPEDWTAPMGDVEADDLGYSETATAPANPVRSLATQRTPGDAWEDAGPDEERSPPRKHPG